MTIQHIPATAGFEPLEDWGTVGKPLSEPACTLRGVARDIPGFDGERTGIWECSPGRFQREVTAGEVMHILCGAGTFTPDTGEAITFQAGDTLICSPMTTGVWDIRETVRKVYVLLPPEAPQATDTAPAP